MHPQNLNGNLSQNSPAIELNGVEVAIVDWKDFEQP
jgi:hypothetical protein